MWTGRLIFLNSRVPRSVNVMPTLLRTHSLTAAVTKTSPG